MTFDDRHHDCDHSTAPKFSIQPSTTNTKMENLLESNERTLVMFEAVLCGLSNCLALVYSDIKQMTEHRNKLAKLEHQQLEAKLTNPNQEFIVLTNNNNSQIVGSHRSSSSSGSRRDPKQQQLAAQEADQDHHHLASLKLLDKRLADSFSQVLSLSDLQKSSYNGASKHAAGNRPSIFQVLLGKTSAKARANKQEAGKREPEPEQPDNRAIIDDINRQTRMAMQYSKQLEAHLFKVEDLRSKYEMHLKMGLVVKSVARAYLSPAHEMAHQMGGSPASLARRQMHCSSLVVNRNDSNSTGTHSSLSSLNLSTWSWSRSRSRSRGRDDSAGQQPEQQRQPLEASNQFASSLSLSASHKQRRLNLTRLISSPQSTAVGQPRVADSQQPSHRRVSSQSSYSPSAYAYADWLPADGTIQTGYQPIYPTHQTHIGSLSKSQANLYASHNSLHSKASKHQASSIGSSKGSNDASRTTIKEFIENINRIENEFESFMGSFMLTVDDIQGFARVCQGDVFEISIKYGDAQKFKTKISVLKDNKQKCDHNQTIFKASIADVLAIKAYECKGLGKRLLLGHKLCETRDLFTARSQMMTISLNQTGSIKLNLIVTWNPLHFAPSSAASAPGFDLSHLYLPPTPVSSSTLSSLSSVPSLQGATTTINITSQNANKQIQRQSANEQQQQQQQLNQSNISSHQDSMYQSVNSSFGYYIPPPDYLVDDSKISD